VVEEQRIQLLKSVPNHTDWSVHFKTETVTIDELSEFEIKSLSDAPL